MVTANQVKTSVFESVTIIEETIKSWDFSLKLIKSTIKIRIIAYSIIKVAFYNRLSIASAFNCLNRLNQSRAGRENWNSTQQAWKSKILEEKQAPLAVPIHGRTIGSRRESPLYKRIFFIAPPRGRAAGYRQCRPSNIPGAAYYSRIKHLRDRLLGSHRETRYCCRAALPDQLFPLHI